jgi:cytochrome oxidase Cu insertion factor (SCO1/SenC/PrrC family)
METQKRATARILFGMLLVTALGVVGGHEAAALEIGKPAPDFTLPSTTGEKISLSQFRGKLVLVEFYGGAFFPE